MLKPVLKPEPKADRYERGKIQRNRISRKGSGAVKMTVEMDDHQEEHAKVSHKCSKAYGREATTMIAQLDMIHDLYLSDMED